MAVGPDLKIMCTSLIGTRQKHLYLQSSSNLGDMRKKAIN